MSATLKVIHRIVVESGNENPLDFGSIVEAIQDTAVAGVPAPQILSFVLAAGASATLWDYTVNGNFVAFLALSDGYVWIEETVDSPTSASNLAASGLATNRPKDGVSCFAPWYRQGMATPVVPTSGGHQDNYVSSFHASTVNGRRYKIVAKNPSDALAAVTVRALIVL